jgi:hypothetical protein
MKAAESGRPIRVRSPEKLCPFLTVEQFCHWALHLLSAKEFACASTMLRTALCLKKHISIAGLGFGKPNKSQWLRLNRAHEYKQLRGVIRRTATQVCSAMCASCGESPGPVSDFGRMSRV